MGRERERLAESMRARTAIVIAALGLTLLLIAWVPATQPFAAPDEASHYLRALNITNGHLLGPKVNYHLVPGLTLTQLAWVDRDTRAAMVPARLSPPNVSCMNGRPDLTGRCREATPDGNFPPWGYLLPAVALGLSRDVSSGIWLSRVASMLPCLCFLLLAVALLWGGTGSSLLGLLAATSPMVLFTSAILNSSGIEITACLAFTAAVLRVSRTPARVPRWAWIAFGITGAVATVSWPLGPLFVIANLALFAALLGRHGLREIRSTPGRPQWIAMMTLVAGGVLWLIYSRVAGLSPARFGVSPIVASLKGGFHQLGPVLRDVVGTFGSLTVHLPAAAYWIWWLLVLTMVAAAIRLGGHRERVLLVTVFLLVLAFPVLFWAWFDRFSGFGVGGREVLPILTLIPLLAGELIYRRSGEMIERRSIRLLVTAAISVIALFQAYAWWFNARETAGAPHTLRFYVHATWSPPLGWIPWIVIATFGTAALLAFAASVTLTGSRRSLVPFD